MKGWIVLTSVVAAAVGMWWWWRRREGLPFLPGGPPPPPYPPGGYLGPVYNDGIGSPLYPYAVSVANTPPGGLPPVPPTGVAGLSGRDQAGQVIGTGAGLLAMGTCIYVGGGPLCGAAMPIGSYVGTKATQGLFAVKDKIGSWF